MAKKLMLADGSHTIQKVVELVLVPEGFDVVSYGNGEDALGALDSITPDIILADIEMPELDGYQLCEKVRSNPRTSHIPVILLAGAFEPFDEDHLKSVGADDFILKPFEPHELVTKIKSLLAQNDSEVIKYRAEEEKPSVSSPAEILSAESQRVEGFRFAAKNKEKGETVDFESGLRERLKAPEREQTDRQSPEPEAMSIEEISRMVKEAVGMPAGLKTDVKAAPPVMQTSTEGLRPPDTQTIESIIRASVQDLAGSLKEGIEETIRQQVVGILPGIFEEQLKKTVAEMSEKMQSIAEAEIKKAVPGIAERLIRGEIEKITSELA
jgi:DNA-binding response OmpR family regulator